MDERSTEQTFQILVISLLAVTIVILGFVGVVLALNRSASARAIAATLTAMPSPAPPFDPTPVPTLPGVNEELLVCQREAGQAMSAREMVGGVNISDDHLFLIKWVSLDWQVDALDDALAGVILGFDAAVDVWEQGCAVYDRVQVDVYDRRNEEQLHQLTVRVGMDDLLKWRAGELRDSDLIARLQVTEASGAARAY
jgi:hypothetical protein